MKAEQTAGTYLMDKKKWERWINHSGESIDWTIDHMEKQGLKCCLEPGYYDPDGTITVPPASHNFYTDEQPFGALYGAPLEAQAYADIFTGDFGGEIHYKTVAQYLIREDDNTGRVSGVVAQREDGSYVKYVANKAVVLATGDFSKNPDMMAKYSPWAWEHFKDALSFGDVDYDAELVYSGLMPGDGQKMGLWVGAAWQKTYPVPPMINGGASGPAHGVISNFWGSTWTSTASATRTSARTSRTAPSRCCNFRRRPPTPCGIRRTPTRRTSGSSSDAASTTRTASCRSRPTR